MFFREDSNLVSMCLDTPMLLEFLNIEEVRSHSMSKSASSIVDDYIAHTKSARNLDISSKRDSPRSSAVGKDVGKSSGRHVANLRQKSGNVKT